MLEEWCSRIVAYGTFKGNWVLSQFQLCFWNEMLDVMYEMYERQCALEHIHIHKIYSIHLPFLEVCERRNEYGISDAPGKPLDVNKWICITSRALLQRFCSVTHVARIDKFMTAHYIKI